MSEDGFSAASGNLTELEEFKRFHAIFEISAWPAQARPVKRKKIYV
jgi:hypothetical protein